MGDKKIQYQVLKIGIKHFIEENGDGFTVKEMKELDDMSSFKINQDTTSVFDQLERIRGFKTQFVEELIFLEAKHNKKHHDVLSEILNHGIVYDSNRYYRFGKSNSQAKDGITVFAREDIFEELFKASMLGLELNETVISKFESYRNLIFSSATLIKGELPNIVIVDEFTKIIPDQLIRYVVREDAEFTTEEGEVKKYEKREIKEGKKDLEISPCDGCGCHSAEIGEKWKETLEKDYRPASVQVRLPFTKGLSVEVDFKSYYRDSGITEITDVFGRVHKVDDIDCLWNVSMWKGYKYFKEQFGNKAWDIYIDQVNKYEYSLGISKYSHHTKDMDLKRRMNFQYLQTLDLWNDKYIQKYKDSNFEYDILDESNHGDIINMAKYSTDLFEKIISGDKFYSMKFLGIGDTKDFSSEMKYLEAVAIDDRMLKDPIVRKLLMNTTSKMINEMKFGKIFSDGFFHTICGDMKFYLDRIADIETDNDGCLDAWEVFIDTKEADKATLFRSPCVCSSEVSNVKVSNGNDFTKKYMTNFKDQDVIMFSSNDILMPQLGGADADGDLTYVSTCPITYEAKIEKPIIIDIEDKATASKVKYNQHNITQYELNSRDSRIGEITNIATSILNNYTESDKWKKVNDHNISLLRIYQGKEIDFLKTGKRWVITQSLRKNLKKLPYFLLHNYPVKMNSYLKQKKKKVKGTSYNCFHSPSPMNELCDYVETWEKKKIKWSKEKLNTSSLLIDNSYNLSDNKIFKECRIIINNFSKDWADIIKIKDDDSRSSKIKELYKEYKSVISSTNERLGRYTDDEVSIISRREFANYFIKASTYRIQTNKYLCWEEFGDIMIENLKKNSPKTKRTRIVECDKSTDGCYEYLGKYYEMIEGEE